jgi:hypothetical protein
MTTNNKEYKNLIGLLLGPIRERPAMYLGENKISNLPNFIIGYSMGFLMAKNADTPIDNYFDNPGFITWYLNTKKITWASYWHTLFLEEAKGDEKEALDLFFKYLEEYSKYLKTDT